MDNTIITMIIVLITLLIVLGFSIRAEIKAFEKSRDIINRYLNLLKGVYNIETLERIDNDLRRETTKEIGGRTSIIVKNPKAVNDLFLEINSRLRTLRYMKENS